MSECTECPYCGGCLSVEEDTRIGAYIIVCDICGARWIDEDEIDKQG